MSRGLAAVVLAALALSCSESEQAREEKAMKSAIPQRLQADGSIRLSDADRAALGLVVEPAREGQLPDTALRFGRVVTPPGQEGLVVAPVTGQIRRAPLVQLGQTVKAGDPLLDLMPVLAAADRASIGVQTAQLDGQIEATQRELEGKQADLARARELAASNIVSQQKLQETETAVATTKAELAGLRRARSVQARAGGAGAFTLRAPVDGVVVTLNAAVGAGVNQGDVLVRVLKPGPQLVDVAVAPGEAAGAGYEVQVGDAWISARLAAEGGRVENGTRHDRLAVEAEKPVRLLSGATVPVRVARTTSNGVILAESAIVPVPGGEVVYVETEANVFTPRTLKVAARFAGKARLASGVKPGEKVVVQGAIGLRGESLRAELRHTE